jgi:hypothetical protein
MFEGAVEICVDWTIYRMHYHKNNDIDCGDAQKPLV